MVPPGCPTRKFCYVIKRSDLQTIFNDAGVLLESKGEKKFSYWNRRYPQKEEYGVEICVDDSGSTNNPKDPVYLVYDKHWNFGKQVECQHLVYSNQITPDQADKLADLLKNYDVP